MSKISTSDGKEPLLDAITGTQKGKEPKVGEHSKSTCTWPQQPRPSQKACRLWETMVRSATETDYERYCRLTQPLGHWTKHHSEGQKWRWYEDERHGYDKKHKPIRRYAKHQQDRKEITCAMYEEEVNQKPTTSVPCTRTNKLHIKVPRQQIQQPIKMSKQEPIAFLDQIHAACPGFREIITQANAMIDNNSEHKIMHASDGG